MLMAIREIVFETSDLIEGSALEETLKWGEPAYRVRGGSTVRLGWKAPTPNEVAVYFICTTGLVDRFRELYPATFRFGGKRALQFELGEKIPKEPLQHCIALAFTYHRKRSAQ